MEYKQYPNHTKAYIVVRMMGSGAQGDTFSEQEVCFETDDKIEAVAKIEELTIANNTPEEIKSSWKSNTFLMNINTCSEYGKKLEEDFSEIFEKRLKDGIAANRYRKETINGIDCYFDKSMDGIWNTPKEELPTRIAWSEIKKDG